MYVTRVSIGRHLGSLGVSWGSLEVTFGLIFVHLCHFGVTFWSLGGYLRIFLVQFCVL